MPLESFNKHLLSTYYMSGNDKGTGSAMVPQKESRKKPKELAQHKKKFPVGFFLTKYYFYKTILKFLEHL